MSVSPHDPKTGQGFQQMRKREYGNRLLLDYGDWVGLNSPEAIAGAQSTPPTCGAVARYVGARREGSSRSRPGTECSA